MKRRGLAILLGAAILMGMLASIPHVLTLDVVQAMTSFGEEHEADLYSDGGVFGDEMYDADEEEEEAPDEEEAQIALLDEEDEIEAYRPQRQPVQLSLDPDTYCGLPAHIHGVFCYDENSDLICDASEHEHDDFCYVDPDASENDENGVETEENESEETESWSVDENETGDESGEHTNSAESDLGGGGFQLRRH